jgi:hypothetical protein
MPGQLLSAREVTSIEPTVTGRQNVRTMDAQRRTRRGQMDFVRSKRQVVCSACILCDMSNPIVDELLARQVAAVVMADVRTVRRAIRGEGVRGFVGARIQAELERRRQLRTAQQQPSQPR